MENKLNTCKICGETKSFEFFHKNNTYASGYMNKCKECRSKTRKADTKKYYAKNRDRIIAYAAKYKKSDKKKNPEKYKALHKKYYDANKQKILDYGREHKKKMRHSDPLFKMTHNMRVMLRAAFKKNGYTKVSQSHQLIGCSFIELKSHIEQQFESWMNWDNYGKFNRQLNFGWDIDHIIPLSSAKSEEELKKLNHYTNLRPLCSYTNRHIKQNKLI